MSGYPGGESQEDRDDTVYETRVYAAEGGLWVSVGSVGRNDSLWTALAGGTRTETALLLPITSPLRLTVEELGKLVEATADVMRGHIRERLHRAATTKGGPSAPRGGAAS